MENQPAVNQLPSEPIIQKQSNFLVILLSILLFISVVIAVFFAYQTQQLVKELTAYSVQVAQTSTPIASPESTPDPTADWKTYTNIKYNFNIKYLNNWYVMTFKNGEDKESSNNVLFGPGADYRLQIEVTDKKTKSFEDVKAGLKNRTRTWTSVSNSEISIDGIKAYKFSGMDQGNFNQKVLFLNGEYIYQIYGQANEYFDQILSTFKFTN